MTSRLVPKNSTHLETEQCYLMAENDPVDAEIFSSMLDRAFKYNFRIKCVDTYRKVFNELRKERYDALILDLHLSDHSGLNHILTLSERYPALPIVVLTGNNDYDLAINSLHSGAQDYLTKNNVTPDTLSRSLRHAIERKQIEKRLKKALRDAGEMNAKLDNQAKRDPLTGLANRAYFQEAAEDSLHRAKRRNQKLALLYFDLNEFKKINDNYGHAIGDELLKEVAQRLQHVVRGSDVLARIGGDEFIILTDAISKRNDVYPLIQRIKNQFKEGFLLGNHYIDCATSIGIAFFPEADNLDLLIKQADFAMYKAKRSVNTAVCFYSEKIAYQYARTQLVESHWECAVSNKEVYTAFQPILNVNNAHEVHLEALARWQSITLGYVPPDEFVPIAENSPFIDDMTKFLTLQTKEIHLLLQNDSFTMGRISINVSPRQLANHHFGPLFLEWLSQTKLPCKHICIELTERQVVQNMDQCRQQFDFLHKHGIHVSLDDYGSGFSSVTHLLELPFDVLKLDKGLMTNIDTDFRNQALVAGIIEMAHRLNMHIVAEGIETQAEYNQAIELGCDYIQGFYFSKPLPPNETLLFYKNTNEIVEKNIQL